MARMIDADKLILELNDTISSQKEKLKKSEDYISRAFIEYTINIFADLVTYVNHMAEEGVSDNENPM